MFWLAWLIEGLLVLGSVFCLSQPEAIFNQMNLKSRVKFRILGWAFLAILFCWSIALGSYVTFFRYQQSGGFY